MDRMMLSEIMAMCALTEEDTIQLGWLHLTCGSILAQGDIICHDWYFDDYDDLIVISWERLSDYISSIYG